MRGYVDVLTCVGFAATLWFLGRWGRSNVEDLIAGHLPDDEREHRRQVLLRGTMTAQVVAVIFAVVAVALLFI